MRRLSRAIHSPALLHSTVQCEQTSAYALEHTEPAPEFKYDPFPNPRADAVFIRSSQSLDGVCSLAHHSIERRLSPQNFVTVLKLTVGPEIEATGEKRQRA